LQRVCFVLKVRPERMEEYRERHRHVWQEMRDALHRAGWRDYSLFLSTDGLLVGYLTCDDFQSCLEAMEREEVNARWQAQMVPFFVMSERPDQAMHPLEEIFHLD
jgi:L-rhamnose mutarotase